MRYRVTQMKAVICLGEGKSNVIVKLPESSPGPSALVLKTHRCWICATDRSMTKGGMWEFPTRSQCGTEFADNLRQLAARLLPSPACRHCEACRIRGNPGAMPGELRNRHGRVCRRCSGRCESRQTAPATLSREPLLELCAIMNTSCGLMIKPKFTFT